MSQYSFTAYAGAVASVGAHTIVVPARDFAVDLEAMLAAIDPTVAVIYLATINNPTGTCLDADALQAFIAGVPPHIVVVLDEAYREYVHPSERPDTDHLPEARPNVVVLRTFSKIHGLAGLRVGYAIADPRMVRVLRRLQLPFCVSAPAEAAAVAALADEAFQAQARSLNATERARVQAALAAGGIEYVPSHGNFILLRVGNGREVFQALQRRGIIVRPVDNYGLPQWIRVSVGLPHENDRFLQALPEAMT
jgi:histidinol-phosphate aminotransferase